jgi:imidazolonepropionase-like amidohydrolase
MKKMILINFNLLDGLGDMAENAAIETDDTGRIVRIWSGRGSLPSSAGAIDLEGRFVLPGLIDCHVHLTADASADPVAARVHSPEGYLAILGARNAERTLRRGVTTIRDTGAPHFTDASVKRSIRDGLVEGPRMLSSGKMLTMTGGHGCLVGQEVDGPVEARKYARLNLKMGADNIKMVASGGLMTPNADPQAASLTIEELAAGFEEARKAGRLSACHAHSLEGVKNAIRAGVRTIEHGVCLDEEACQLMVRAGIFYCPTLSVVRNLTMHSGESGVQPHVRKRIRWVAETLAKSFAMARDLGVKIICGTDAGMPFTDHGETATEVRLMVEAGISTGEAIRIATSQSAQALRVDDRTGSVAPGKMADLLVVDSDPLADIGALATPTHVFKGGRLVTAAGARNPDAGAPSPATGPASKPGRSCG